MNDLSVTKPYQRRRRFSREFKAQIVAQCQEPGASVSRISLDNGLNANMVRRWMSEAQRARKRLHNTGICAGQTANGDLSTEQPVRLRQA